MLEMSCRPLWFIILPWSSIQSIFYAERMLLNICSLYMSLHFACRSLETHSVNQLTLAVFGLRNPLNNVPVVALLFTTFLTTVLSSFLNIDTLFNVQVMNILFFRVVVSLTALLRRHSNLVMSRPRCDNEDDVAFRKKRFPLLKLDCIFFLLSVVSLVILLVMIEYVSLSVLSSKTGLLWILLGIVPLILLVFSPLVYLMLEPLVSGLPLCMYQASWDCGLCMVSFLLIVLLLLMDSFRSSNHPETAVFVLLYSIGTTLYVVNWLIRRWRRRKSLNRDVPSHGLHAKSV